MNGAGTALLDAAAVLGAVQLEMIPQRPEQGCVFLYNYMMALTINYQFSHQFPRNKVE